MKALQNASALASTLLHTLETRMELLGLEMRLERNRVALLIALIILACGTFLLTWVGLFALLAVVLPAGVARITVLAVCVGLLALMCLGCVLAVVKLARSQSLPFAETREELKKDAQCLASAIKDRK